VEILLNQSNGLIRANQSNGTVPSSFSGKEGDQTQAPPPPQHWAQLVAGTRLTSKGTSLQFIAPTVKNATPVAQLE